MEMQPTNLTNHFLIAMPALTDPNFFQTVTYICAHNNEGAMGIIINRPLDLELGDVLSQMKMQRPESAINATMVFHGGPVQQERGFVIHKPSREWEATINVGDDIGVATSRDILEAVANGSGPEHTLVALGYAGWGAAQVEQEIVDNTWLSCPADARILFNTPPEERWHSAAALVGVDLDRLSHDIGHA